jgi:hypothetical protein
MEFAVFASVNWHIEGRYQELERQVGDRKYEARYFTSPHVGRSFLLSEVLSSLAKRTSIKKYEQSE